MRRPLVLGFLVLGIQTSLATAAAAAPVAFTGRVLGSDGRALAGATVALRPQAAGPDLETVRDALTDERGFYRSEIPTLGRWSLRVEAPGFLPMVLAVETAGEAPQVPAVQLPAAARLVVEVRDRRGRAIEGALVLVRRVARTGWHPAPRRGRSDASGRLGLLRAAGEPLEVSAAAPGYLARESVTAEVGSAVVQIVLDRPRAAFGRVLDDDERPLAGASVRLSPADRPPEVFGPGPAGRRIEAETDRDGRFEIEKLAPGKFDLAVGRQGFAPALVPALEVPPGDGQLDLGTVVLTPGAVLDGQVVDPSGSPLAGAELRLELGASTSEQRTDAAGRFAFTELPTGRRMTLDVEHAGHASARFVHLEAPLSEPLEVVLVPAGRISGWVEDADGWPVVNAEVVVLPDSSGVPDVSGRRSFAARASERAPTMSDEAGWFSCDDVEPGIVHLQARRSGLPPGEVVTLTLAPGQDLADIRLVFPPTAIVEGQVQTAGGEVVAGVAVSLGPPSWSHGTERGPEETVAVTTDARGSFRARGVAAGPLRLEARHPSYRPAVEDLIVEPGTLSLEITLEPGLEIAGRVVDDHGRPGARARVQLLGAPPGGRTALTVSGDDGAFLFRGLEADVYQLRASRDGFADAVVPELVSLIGGSVRGLELVLTAGAAVHGHVLGAATDELADVRVVAVGPGGESAAAGVDFEGAYRFEHLRYGRWELRATLPASGRQAWRLVTLEPGSDAPPVDLELATGLSLTGLILADGDPLPAAAVEVVDPFVGTGRGTALTSPSGRFEVSGLEPGSYELRVRAAPALRYREPVELSADRDLVVEIATLGVAGTVLEAGGGVLAGAEVSLEAMDPTSVAGFGVAAARSSPDGTFLFAAVASGRYRLRASKPGYGLAETALVASTGARLDGLELVLEPEEPASLDVRLWTGLPPSRVAVAVADGDGRIRFAGELPVGGDGRARLPSVGPGRWQVLVAAPGAATAVLALDVPGAVPRVALEPEARMIARLGASYDGASGLALVLRGPLGTPFRRPAGRGIQERFPLLVGATSVPNLPAGTWALELQSPAGPRAAGVVTVVPGVDTEVALEAGTQPWRIDATKGGAPRETQ